MNDFFANLVIGHLIGDYLLQNKWMAINKSKSSFRCFVHCFIYTIAVTLTTYENIQLWYWPIIIFLTHYPVDRYNLADKWLNLINGRSLSDFISNGQKDIPEQYNFDNYHALRGGFTAFVYAATDNTMHLASMYLIGKLFI